MGVISGTQCSATSNNMKLVHWPLMGCYIWYNEERSGRGRSPPKPMLAVPNVTPITVLLYNGLLLCSFIVPIKGLAYQFENVIVCTVHVVNSSTTVCSGLPDSKARALDNMGRSYAKMGCFKKAINMYVVWCQMTIIYTAPPQKKGSHLVFIARQHTDARYWYSNSVRQAVCASVRLTVTRSRIRWKRLNILSQFFQHTVANHSSFTGIKHLHKIPTGSLPAKALNTGWV